MNHVITEDFSCEWSGHRKGYGQESGTYSLMLLPQEVSAGRNEKVIHVLDWGPCLGNPGPPHQERGKQAFCISTLIPLILNQKMVAVPKDPVMIHMGSPPGELNGGPLLM